MTPDIEQVIAEALRGAGLSDRPDEFDSNIHSWRCEHPDRYGHCKCFEETVADLAAALRAANMLRESGVPDAATAESERRAWAIAGHLERDREAVKAERDAALAAIERVQETLSLHNPNGRLVKEVLAALDGAPELVESEGEEA